MLLAIGALLLRTLTLPLRLLEPLAAIVVLVVWALAFLVGLVVVLSLGWIVWLFVGEDEKKGFRI